MSRRSWGLGDGGKPLPWPTPVPPHPKPSKLDRFELWVLHVMFATPIPARWEPKA